MEVSRLRQRPLATLFLISFVVLFVELMLIRYCSSQIRVFSFYKNVPLIGCFVGLGLGCCLGRGTPRHALAFPRAATLAEVRAVIEGRER